jgi:hypothetical protein
MILESRLTRLLCWVQGAYFAVTGVWPIFHIASFEWLTGPKTDDWLVKTTGALITVIGLVLLTAAYQRKAHLQTAVLAIGSAVALALVDVIYATKGVISRIYLLDAGPEFLFAVLWLFAIRGEAHRDGSSSSAPDGSTGSG